MHRIIRLTTAVLVAVFVAIPSLFAGTYEEGKIYRHVLPNSLVLFTMERHIAPVIFHQLTYRVGSRNEHLGITGISHVVEHMMFKGTPKYGKGAASKTISQNAGIFNAFTANDMTSYYEYLPANRIEIALDIESDRMQNCMFDTAEFRSEVQVIKQERRMRSESTSGGVIQENLNSIAYMSHPNRDPIIGWMSDLGNMTREDAYEYYKTYYSPNNAFLVLVGDFDTDAMVAMVTKYYGAIPQSRLPRELKLEDQQQRVKKTMTIRHNDITAPTLTFAFHVPTIHDEDGPALRTVQLMFSARARTARLYKRLVEDRQIASGAAGGMGTTKDPTLYRITVSLMKDSSIQTAEAIVWEEIKKMQDELVSERELQKAKNRYTFDQVSSYTKNGDIGSRMSTYEQYFGIGYIEEFMQRMQKVTREDVQRVMRKYFVEENVTMVYAYPKNPNAKAGKRQSADEEQPDSSPQVMPNDEPQNEDAFYFLAPWLDPEAGKPLANLDDIARPKPIAPTIKKNKLDNGVTIYTIENRLTPTVFIGGLFETGLIPEADKGGKPGIVSMLTAIMSRGTTSMPYDTLTERMAFVPFTFSVGGSYRSLNFQGNSLTKDADEMLTVGLELVTQPGFRQEDLDKLRLRAVEQARKRRKTTREIAFYHMFDSIFLDHPYARTSPTVESLNSITMDDLRKLHKKYFNPKSLTLVMVGDFTHREMVKLANRYFGTWTTKAEAPAPKKMPAAKELTAPEIKLFTDAEYTESTINIGFAPFNNVKDENEETIEILNHILAGSALTSRMGLELRDKRGLVYGIKSQLWSMSDGIGYWKLNTKTAPKNTEEVITVIFAEIRKMIESGLTDDELATAKKRLLGLLPFYIETPDDVASRVFEMLNQKKSFDSFDKKADRLLAVTKEDCLRVARKYFTMDKFVVVVDGPLQANALDSLKTQLFKH